MEKISLMLIPCGFKIKKKSDCQKFITDCMCVDSSYTITISRQQLFFIEVDKERNVTISEKRGDLSDMWNPLFEVTRTKDNCYDITVEDAIWKLRKYINTKWFN